MHPPRRHAAPLRCLALAPLLLLCAAAPCAPAFAPSRPFPQHASYAAGSIRPAHRSQAEQDDDVRALYWSWKRRYVAQAGSEADGRPRYRVKAGRGADAATVSEGQGFGLWLAALMAGEDPDARSLFDGLIEFALDHPSAIDPRLMDWKVAAEEGPDGEGDDSAFDGDRDIAAALLLAAEQWGDGGRFDYTARARAVLAGLRDSALGPESRLPLLGDWVDPAGARHSQWTPRPSDLRLDALRAFAGVAGSPWAEALLAAQATLAQVQARYAPDTGLFPDFLEPLFPDPVAAADHTLRPASPHLLEGPHDGDFYYNALRVPLWLGIDALLHGDALSRELARKVALFTEGETGGDPLALRAGYRLDGTPLPGSDYFTTAFAAPLAVAAMLAPEKPEWLEALYDAVRRSDEDYYEDTLSLLSLLVLSGNVWAPVL